MRKEERILMYGQIFALKSKDYISQIAHERGLSRPTVQVPGYELGRTLVQRLIGPALHESVKGG